MGKRFDVYSRRDDDVDLHRTEMDLKRLADGDYDVKYQNESGQERLGISVPEAEEPAYLPGWLEEHLNNSEHWTQNGLQRGPEIHHNRPS